MAVLALIWGIAAYCFAMYLLYYRVPDLESNIADEKKKNAAMKDELEKQRKKLSRLQTRIRELEKKVNGSK